MRAFRCLTITALLLGGCGGGGSGGSSSPPTAPPTSGPSPTPAPTLAPTPAPVPPPSSPLRTGEIRPATDAVVSATTLQLTVSGKTTSNRSTTSNTPQFALRFDTSSQRYVLANAQYQASFGSPEFTRETSVPDFFPRVEFERRATGGDDFFVIFKAPNATPPVTPRFGAYGAWQHNVNAGTTQVRLDYFTYGSATPVSSMPMAGIVRYRLTGTGNYANDSELFFVQSDSTITVDFAKGTVSGVIGLTGTNFFGASFGGKAAFQVPGSITGNFVDAPISSSIAVQSGRFRMQFLGPNADELSIAYQGLDVTQAFVGAAIGTRLN